MTGMTQPIARKGQKGQPTTNKAHFAFKDQTESAVVLGPRTEEEYSRSIENPAELEEVLRQEMGLFELDAGTLDFTAADYGPKLHAVTEQYVEHFADVITRIDGVTSDEADDLFLRIVGPKMTDRVAKFNASWRAVETDGGDIVVKQGAWNDPQERTFTSLGDAQAEAARENARFERAGKFSRAARVDRHWDAELWDEDLATVDAYAAAKPNDAMNVTAVNLWFGMVRFDKLQSPDELVVDDKRRPQHVKDMLRSDRTLALRVDPDVLRTAGDLDGIARTVGNSDEHFGTLVGAMRRRDGHFLDSRISTRSGTYSAFKLA